MSEKERQVQEHSEQKQPAIIFLSISLALLLAFIGFFAWHTARMRNYELNYVRAMGTIVDVQSRDRRNRDFGLSVVRDGARRNNYA